MMYQRNNGEKRIRISGRLVICVLLLALLCALAVSALADSEDPLSAEDMESATSISLGSSVSVTVADDEYKILSFTPAESGLYSFVSSNSDDSYAILYDQDGEYLTYNDDGGLSNNFSVHYPLIGDSKYYLKVYGYNYEADSFIVSVNRLEDIILVESVNMNGLDGRELTPGFWYSFSWTFSPQNADYAEVWFESVPSGLDFDDDYTRIRGTQGGEYKVIAHLTNYDDTEVTAEATVTFRGIDGAPAETLTTGSQSEVTISEAGSYKVLSFTPAETGTYVFHLSSNYEAWGGLYDAEYHFLRSNTYEIRYDLQASNTYYLLVHWYSLQDTGSIGVSVEKKIPVESFTVSPLTLYEGERGKFSVSVQPAGADIDSVRFDNEDNDNYELDNDGDIWAYKACETTVQAFIENNETINASAKLTILSLRNKPVEEALELNKTATTAIDTAGSSRLFSFTPTADGAYTFESSSESDTYGRLYDSDFNCLKYNDDGGMNTNFLITYDLQAGKKYYLQVRLYSINNTGSVPVTVSAHIPVTGISVEDLTLYPGEYGHFITSVTPANASNPYVYFEYVENDEYYLETDGYVQAYKPGTYTVYAYSAENSGFTAEATLTVLDFPAQITAEPGIPCTVNIPAGGYRDILFIPEQSGTYIFSSSGSNDVWATLFKSNWQTMDPNSSTYYSNGNFRYEYYLMEYNYYYLRVSFEDPDINGTTTILIEPADPSVVRISIEDAEIEEIPDFIYSGSEYTPAVTVTLDGDVLEEDEDYTVYYSDNVDAGTATVLITGLGNYEGSITTTFTINPKPITAEMIALEFDTVEYTGEEMIPAVTVTDDGTELDEDVDYTVQYADNEEPGEATVTVSGTGNYTGTEEITFIITPADLQNAVIEEIDAEEFIGIPLTPEVIVTLNGEQLNEGLDYTVEYADNIDAGTATVTVTGKGCYTGTLTAQFTIEQAFIEDAEIEPIAPVAFTGEAAKPALTVTYGSYTLEEGTDYTAVYSHNVEIGTATVTLTGIGNFTGSTEEYFTISAKVLTKDMITLDPTEYEYDGTPRQPAVTVSTAEGDLTEGTDYSVSYSNNVNAGTRARVTVTGQGEYDGSLVVYFTIRPKALEDGMVTLDQYSFTYSGNACEPAVTVKTGADSVPLTAGTDYTVRYSGNVDAGTGTVTVTGTRNYTGTATAAFEIAQLNAGGDAEITVNDTNCVYTGAALTPAIQVTLNGKTLTKDRDYEITGYENNVDAGNAAKVKIRLIGNYTGSAEETFSIKAKSLSDGMISLSQASWTYDGSAHLPEVTLKDGEKTLTQGSDYTLEASGETEIGSYTVKATGLGNYTGTAEAGFSITAIDLSGAEIKGLTEKIPYTGALITQQFTVELNGAVLTEGTDYTVNYTNNKNVGIATVTVTGKGHYSGTASVTFEITGISIEDVTIEGIADSYVYSPGGVCPVVTVKLGDETLVEGTAFYVTYLDNDHVGTATVTIEGMRGFTGSTARTFIITAAPIGAGTISPIADQTATGSPLTPAITVKVNGATLTAGTDYTAAYTNNVNPGTATVTVTGKGNYTGSLTGTFTIKAGSVPTTAPTTKPTTAPTPTPKPTPTVPVGTYTDPNGTGSYSISSDRKATFTKPAASAATVAVPDTIQVNGISVPVTAIADNAFKKDKKLTTITIGSNIITIGKNAFNGCAKLKTVKGGANVQEIKASAFSGCVKLSKLPTFKKLKTIGAMAFKDCKVLTKFTVGANVKSIGKNAFNGCAKLKTITIKSTLLTKSSVKGGAFKGINAKATIKCPKKKLADYKKFLPKKGVPKTAKIK